MSPIALVTGANSGIGRATTARLVALGCTTYGGARRAETFPAIEAAGAHPIRLDMTDEQSMLDAVKEIEAAHGAVDVLVNNAGYGEMGPIEEVGLKAWQRQFETNVFGLVRLTQMVLPGMRGNGRGRIINISSGGGEFTYPLAGAYHASKYALEAISDALRFEVAPFGVRVIVVQPGVVDTPLAASTVDSIRSLPNSPYAPLIDAFRRTSAQAQANKTGYVTPEAVADVIARAALTTRPRTRYKVGALPRMLSLMRHTLPDRAWDSLIARFYPVTS